MPLHGKLDLLRCCRGERERLILVAEPGTHPFVNEGSEVSVSGVERVEHRLKVAAVRIHKRRVLSGCGLPHRRFAIDVDIVMDSPCFEFSLDVQGNSVLQVCNLRENLLIVVECFGLVIEPDQVARLLVKDVRTRRIALKDPIGTLLLLAVVLEPVSQRIFGDLVSTATSYLIHL